MLRLPSPTWINRFLEGMRRVSKATKGNLRTTLKVSRQKLFHGARPDFLCLVAKLIGSTFWNALARKGCWRQDRQTGMPQEAIVCGGYFRACLTTSRKKKIQKRVNTMETTWASRRVSEEPIELLVWGDPCQTGDFCRSPALHHSDRAKPAKIYYFWSWAHLFFTCVNFMINHSS